MRRILALAACTVLALAAAPALAAPMPLPSATSIQVLPKPGTDLTALPLGDTKVTTTGPGKVGWTWACTPGNPNAPGAIHDGPWIEGDTWNLLEKLAVRGDISWKSAAKYAEQSTATLRTITTMRVPTVGTTGEFPIAKDDPAYQYDRNPSSITPRTKTVSIPMNPVKAAKTSCLPMGAIGIAVNGVMLYNALDARNMDARAHEMQDSCEGHPNFAEYHYHAGSACVVGIETGSSTLFGYAFDGFGIYVERDKNGNMLTNKSLDACHGRTSKVMWNGKMQKIYHYVVTQEFPYLLGCFTGTNSVPAAGGPQG
ncbi:MAG: YHYH protein [Actinomycetota bacterium]